MAMTINQLIQRLTDIRDQNVKEGHPERNGNEVWVSYQQSPRRCVMVPITAVWGGTLVLPVPEDNAAGYKDKVLCVEARTDARSCIKLKR